MELNGKKVAVLGCGTSGFCAARLAQKKGAVVTTYDSGATEKLAKAVDRFKSAGFQLVTGEAALAPEDHFDITVISPGIDASWPLAKAFDDVSDELIGEIEFAWRLSRIPVIAITGTNGKTTTTMLTAHLLNQCGKKAIAAGNCGYAYSDVVYFGEDFDWVVLEVSSFQMETIKDFRPQIAVWMNFAPDHMDRYTSVEDYRTAKMRIFENMTADDLAIIKAEEDMDLSSRQISFSAFSDQSGYQYRNGHITDPAGKDVLDFSATRLNGKHNAENVMVAVAAVREAGVEAGPALSDAVFSFVPPPHRCEVVAEKDGVIFVNDSKSTNLHSLESALLGQDSAVTLIVGGKNKGLDFSELNQIIPKTVAGAVCMGEIADEIAECWGGLIPCHVVGSLKEAVETAYRERGPTNVILFSPGTSSFDMFSGFEERGDCFRKEVANLY
ncbi:MAG: UDP-N-acetylmuramoyl-L-alanine--D-glutamate ligase [Verrucomicrobiales bacterium]|nr:UDP-N-acetylmuramoyl-L-alanine--D-glutamate ligase [Verrucomicrobiales bacterium]